MGREIKRVPLDFDHPIGEVWTGYLRPDDLDLPACPDCGGDGSTPYGRHLHDLWYGNVPFRPQDNGSVPLTADTPAVRAFAERNVTRAPEYYGEGEAAIVREAQRLADLWNGKWSHHLNADDVRALAEAGQLRDFTHTWTKGDGWRPKDPMPIPTPQQVTDWQITSLGSGSGGAYAAIKARAEREGKGITCVTCDGEGTAATPEQQAAYDAWEPTGPPEGDGWQLWSTTTEGHPMSPVFATGDELAEWMSCEPCGFASSRMSLETAMRFVHGSGWSPSMVAAPGHGLEDGITFMARTGGDQ